MKHLLDALPFKISHSRGWLWILVLGLALWGAYGFYGGFGWEQGSLGQAAKLPPFIRWHFLANSDEAKDQALKAAVGEAVMSQASQWFAEAETLNQCREIISRKLPAMQQIAQAKLLSLDSDQRVTIYYGPAWFSARQLDQDAFLPAGTYEALRLVLGQGQGHNWWCLMFPPLSFGTKVSFEIPPQGADFGDPPKKIQVKPCFKLLELLEKKW